MSEGAKKDPMHGKSLKAMLTELVERYGWDELASRISINCFAVNPSLDSSLKFLRKTFWARNKVEDLYMISIGLVPPVRKKVERKLEDDEEPRREPLLPSRRPFKPRPAPSPKMNPWTGKPFEEEG
ncbi:hypothetical protein VDG1235_1621 [Verrucomicrobiia bacterium DG1235]|nr:hypothetical protein VDG1235_1621 [Verrucomicrobiae bacterium DG1235]